MVLIFSLKNSLETVLPALEADGYPSVLNTEGLLYAGLHPQWAQDLIDSLKPDYVINNMPALNIEEGDFIYCGNTKESARLELYKWETRQKAAEIGFDLPEVLDFCPMDEAPVYDEDVFLKPAGLDTGHCAFKIFAGTQQEGLSNTPCYVERMVTGRTAICHFKMCNGSYHIEKIGSYDRRGNDKVFNGKGGFDVTWIEDAKEWLPFDDTKFKALCTDWLDYAATLGGSYSGELEALIADDKIYWMEQNSRRVTYGKYLGTGQAWLDGHTKDPRAETPWHYL